MIRWNIKDRKSGQNIIVQGPTTHQQRLDLLAIIKNCSNMGNIRHGEGAHKHVNNVIFA